MYQKAVGAFRGVLPRLASRGVALAAQRGFAASQGADRIGTPAVDGAQVTFADGAGHRIESGVQCDAVFDEDMAPPFAMPLASLSIVTWRLPGRPREECSRCRRRCARRNARWPSLAGR